MEHHKLDAYNLALEFVPRAHAVAGGFARGLGDLADQLRRASTSIALNIAEGAGEYAPKDKANARADARAGRPGITETTRTRAPVCVPRVRRAVTGTVSPGARSSKRAPGQIRTAFRP